MFGQILYTQYKWTRPVIAVFAVIGFVLPTFLWRVGSEFARGYDMTAIQVVAGFGALGPSLAVFAIMTGFLFVAIPWAQDRSSRHVYPLSLPVSWPQYASMRYGAGVMSMIVPAIAVWLGCVLVLSLVELPPTLRAYPAVLAGRFFMAAALTYSAVFFVQYLLGRRAVMALGLIIVALAGSSVVAELLGLGQVTQAVVRFLIDWPGPLAVFASDWSLVDV